MNLKEDNGLTVSMLRAFVSMGSTWNLSETCRRLGSTRQTVRRYINDLEAIRGEKLFTVSDNKYELTNNGEACLAKARTILLDIDTWANCSRLERNVFEGLEARKYTHDDGREFYSQQQPICRLFESGEPLLQAGLKAWAVSEMRVEHPAMKAIRPYSVLFRRSETGWIFVDIGDESAYSKWFGLDWSRSAIGRDLSEYRAGDAYNDFIDEAYSSVYHEVGVRLDHVFANFPGRIEQAEPAAFQRLLLGVVFPDRTTGLLVLSSMTKDVKIDTLNTGELPEPPQDLKHDLPDDLLLRGAT